MVFTLASGAPEQSAALVVQHCAAMSALVVHTNHELDQVEAILSSHGHQLRWLEATFGAARMVRLYIRYCTSLRELHMCSHGGSLLGD